MAWASDLHSDDTWAREHLRRQLRLLRRAFGLSAEQLSARSGVPSTMIRDLETGRHEPTVASAQRHAYILGCRLWLRPIMTNQYGSVSSIGPSRLKNEVWAELPMEQALTWDRVATQEEMRTLRETAGLTQRALGEVIGIKQSGVEKLESRDNSSIWSWQRYCRGAGGHLRMWLEEMPGALGYWREGQQ